MKNKVVIISLAALLASSAAFAQGVENDDMYFTSKDRAKLKAQQTSEQVAYQASIGKKKQMEVTDEAISNPTDSYSARNENPEFAARSNSQQAQSDNQDYFVSDYRYNTASNLNKFNNNFNSWYSNSWYRPNYYSSSINGWNSPYYGSYYDSWGNPWMNPYYSSGFSSSYSMYMGNSWNYGFGGMGMSSCYMMNPYMNSWASWGSSYGMGMGFGMGYGGYNYYPSSVVIVNNTNGDVGRHVAYGKRASHGGMVTTRQEVLNSRVRPSLNSDPSAGAVRPSGGVYGGRLSSTSGRSSGQEDYYNRTWRNAQQSGSTYSAPSRSSSHGWNNNNGDSYNRQNSFSNPSINNSNSGRSSSFESSGSRSSAPASSGSNGRTRGRD